MDKNKDYLLILIDSLKKKTAVLEDISKINIRQKLIADADTFDLDEFNKSIDEKQILIDKINNLDTGFESIYERINKQLEANPSMYKDEIIKLKDLVRKITELTTKVQVEEKRNKDLMENRIESLKKEVKYSKATNKAAAEYYNSMKNLHIVEPQFLDKKK